jgi:hypothetical protein
MTRLNGAKTAIAYCALIATCLPAPAQTRDVMEDTIMRATYRKSCTTAGSVSAEVASLPLDRCIEVLMSTRGPQYRERLRTLSGADLITMYNMYK